MVLGVDDWIETVDGDIGLVVDTSDAGRASGEIVVYFPAEVRCSDVPVGNVRGKFPKILATRTSRVI